MIIYKHILKEICFGRHCSSSGCIWFLVCSPSYFSEAILNHVDIYIYSSHFFFIKVTFYIFLPFLFIIPVTYFRKKEVTHLWRRKVANGCIQHMTKLSMMQLWVFIVEEKVYLLSLHVICRDDVIINEIHALWN